MLNIKTILISLLMTSSSYATTHYDDPPGYLWGMEFQQAAILATCLNRSELEITLWREQEKKVRLYGPASILDGTTGEPIEAEMEFWSNDDSEWALVIIPNDAPNGSCIISMGHTFDVMAN